MAGKGIDPELGAELAEVAAAQGCELLQVEYQAGTLRLILDREGGVRLEDCETISKLTSALLDVRNFGLTRYTLEVSSPGLDRQLYGPRDYARFVGRRARVRFLDSATGKRATVVGILAAFDDAAQEVELTEIENRPPLRLRLQDIQLAKLVIDA
ncbi:MAG: ribosome maturation factor RimP [Thermoanaerobaculia bacterium]